MQESPELPSPQHFSLQPRSLQSTEIPGQHLPSWRFWAEDGLGCFCSCSPDAINKELSMDKYSEAVNALCICSAFKICAWPVGIYCLDTRLPPCPQQNPRGCADSAPGAKEPQGLGRHGPAPQPSFGSRHVEVVLELGPSTCGFLVATSLPLTLPCPAPREVFVNLIWCILSVNPRTGLTGLGSSSASPFMS